MKIKTLDRVLVRQAIITGRVSDALTGEALKIQPSLTLSWRIDDSSEFRAVAAPLRIKPCADFAFYGIPELFFPELEEGQSLQCCLGVQAEGYQDATATFTLNRSQVSPAAITETYSGFTAALSKLDVPVRIENIALQPRPVNLAGLVVEDNDIATPVSGASISITTPAGGGTATTDAQGCFRIDNLPVVAKVTVQVSSEGNSISEEVLVDYRQRINQRTFSLSV